MPTRSLTIAPLALALLTVAPSAWAHDLKIPIESLRKDVARVAETARFFRARPAIPPIPETRPEHLLCLGNAEVELALGNRKRALELLIGRLSDPAFEQLPEYVGTLLLTSQILEQSAEEVGALHYSALALAHGGTPEEMAEAGARWFRIARHHQRFNDRVEKYELWRKQGGERAAGSELSAEVMYQVAFALKTDRRFADARALLSKVPSESGFGSRSAYLAGVVFVEEGDLTNAERWFSAMMDWPLPALADDHPQLKIERDVRALAALSTGRLRYERGDREGAAVAYKRVPEGSPYQKEACWERAYLDLERGARRGALLDVQCVVDLGASGSRHIDTQLFRASLLAHLSRYADSVEAYKVLSDKVRGSRDMYVAALSQIGGEAELLFAGMERNAIDRGADASPGPATLFGDAWSNEVDLAYRVDRGVDQAQGALSELLSEVEGLSALMERDEPFIGLRVRRQNLERLLQEIHHLEGHAGELNVSSPHASNDGRIQAEEDCHSCEVRPLLAKLGEIGRAVEADISGLNREEESRRTKALTMLREIKAEGDGIAKDAELLAQEAEGPVNQAAHAALLEIKQKLDDAVMRSEYGVLDTYWLKKEHRTRAIEQLLEDKAQTEAQVLEAIQELNDEEAAAPEQAEPITTPTADSPATDEELGGAHQAF